jgi:hypothetical protein
MHLRYHVAFDEVALCGISQASRLSPRHRCTRPSSNPPEVPWLLCRTPHCCVPPQCAWPLLAISHMEAVVTHSHPAFHAVASSQRPAIGECLSSSPCTCPRPRWCRARYEQKIRRERPLGRTFSLAPPWLLTPRLRLGLISPASPPQNLAIKTPSPRPHLHRKRNTSGSGPARRVHFRWISNTRPKPPCALEELSPTLTMTTPIARRRAAEKMAKGPAKDSGGLCLYRKHNDFLTRQRAP